MNSTHPAQGLDNLVHQRIRLGIMAILVEVDRAEFTTIRSLLELTAGNLSRHLALLIEAGLVAQDKVPEGRRMRTWVRMTVRGRHAYAKELTALRALVERFDSTQPEEQ
ncbi:hypothetical protein BH23ACT10_BH23ACT10_35130 [soil metagenome]